MARDPGRAHEEGGEAWPPAWKPQPGERLAGRLIRTDTRTTPYGPSGVAIVEDEAGVSWCVYLSTVLKAAFEEQRPQPEDRVEIQYHGKHESKGYHRHTLVCERPAPCPAQPQKAAPAPRAAARPSAPPPVNRGPAERDDDDPFLD